MFSVNGVKLSNICFMSEHIHDSIILSEEYKIDRIEDWISLKFLKKTNTGDKWYVLCKTSEISSIPKSASLESAKKIHKLIGQIKITDDDIVALFLTEQIEYSIALFFGL